ncbi:MAG: hypothetical protein ACREM2_01860, partial [Vulcanimicrobiaceae bacterium]
MRPSAALLLTLSLAVALAAPIRAAEGSSWAPTSFWFLGTTLIFDHPEQRDGALAVGTDDVGLQRFLARLGATLSYQSGSGYAVIATGAHRTIALSAGDATYTIDGVVHRFAFAPYVQGNALFVPFLELARALGVAPLEDAQGTFVLQPQIDGLSVDTRDGIAVLTVAGAAPLRFVRRPDDADGDLVLAFPGSGSTLEPIRQVASPALASVAVSVSGSPRNPTTVLTLALAPGANLALGPSDAANTLRFAVGPAGATLGGMPLPQRGDAS